MFLQACVKNSLHRRGVQCRGACVVGACVVGACMVRRACMAGGTCMAGCVCVCGKGPHAWQGACMAGGMCARDHAWQHAWQGACIVGVCVVGEMATAADSMHPTGIYSYTLSLQVGTVNWKSFVGKVLLRIKWKFELTYAL